MTQPGESETVSRAQAIARTQEVLRADENIAELHDELSRLDGAARVPKLARLGQELTMRYWRVGPGQPAALGDLSAAIEVWDEAYRLLAPRDPARAEVAAWLGRLLAARHGTHGSGPTDRETGILVLGEALTFTTLGPTQTAVARISLGHLFLGRVAEALSPVGARSGFQGDLPAGARFDADEAIRLFREVLDGPPLSTDITTMTRTLLTLAESIQPLLSGNLAGCDVGKITDAVSTLRRLQETGMPMVPPVPGDPLDYPVTVMQNEAHPAPTVPPRRPTSTAAGPAEPNSARRAGRDRLAALVADRELPVWEQTRALLLVDPSRLAVGDLDALVAAAVNTFGADQDERDADELVESGLDRLLTAVGLCLRERRDGNGWGTDDEDMAGGAYLAAAEQLLNATTLIPPDHPAASVVIEAIGGLLDESRPLSGAITDIADRMVEYAGRITSPSRTVPALAELCRTVSALRAGAAIDPDGFATTLDAIPADHPVRRVLMTAVAHARLAAAVRVDGPIIVDPALGDLAGLLDALLRDDKVALRGALDAASGQISPRVRAVLGAVHLRLGTDLGTAITLLSGAARVLDDEGLRTRTWWRLAEAYRARGAAGDAERSRDAGMTALRGPAPDRRDAARFAGWMLAEGRGVEAFTALEVAAACPEPPAADPLTGDVLSVLIGVSPQAGPSPEPPSPASVAAAIREIGAAALLYLHPTDAAGRIVGVLCLDPATDRLDVVANVPATDPLASDDPGWTALLRRWRREKLLVAAHGGLDRLALPAVRTGDGRYLAQDVVVSHVSSGYQVVQLAARSFAPVDTEPLFVVNPRGDRNPDMAEVMVVRRLFYPRSTCLGQAPEPVDGAGTSDDVLRRLPTASVVHLGCGLRGTELQLAGGEALDVAAVRGAGGLVILSASSVPSLLDAGFAGVVGWRWTVPGPFAALALFMVHQQLVDHRLPPAAAVNAVQRWMLDPDRVLPPLLTPAHLHTVAATDLTRPDLWAALTYLGR